jgi:4-diphosphocytidyl-2-C-methyl-D-erythritol kinase
MMIVFPNAKINIGLRITGKRQDGFHNIETLFYPVGLCDALEFVISDQDTGKDILTSTGIETGSSPADNIVMKAINSLRDKRSFPFLKIHLHKAIPAGAGLGGGSSDAAHLLIAVNHHFNLGIDINELKAISLNIGSDCPFFIYGVPALASGRGENLTSVKSLLTGYYLAILNPGVSISTSEAYKYCHPLAPQESLKQLIEYPVGEWKELILNDFEEYAFKKYPIIAHMKEELYRSGAIFSLMSGSGSSVYGIFKEKPELTDKLKEYVIWEGKM